jgi:ornithine cyclodeaminase
MIVISRQEVAAHLSYETCIPLVRDAMVALARGETRQLLRTIIGLEDGNAFGVMPGAMDHLTFGAKLVSVFPGNFALGKQSHQGVVTVFDPRDGAPVCVLHAGEITAIRTAAASAAATDVLAREDARTLAILGYGEQAWTHVQAMPHVRPIEAVTVWGRSPERAAAFVQRVRSELQLDARAEPTAAAAAATADIICTTTAAVEPILRSCDVADGAHLNVVGSSRAGPVEIDDALVVRSRFFADHRAGVLQQGAEFLNAKAAGLLDEAHVLGEIGQVMDGSLTGRRSREDVTIYKSLGSIVQDLACGWYLYRAAEREGFGTSVDF